MFMHSKVLIQVVFVALALPFAGPTAADDGEVQETLEIFRNAGESAGFFDHSYGYAVFPRIGKGGVGLGAARGHGEVFRQGEPVGEATMTQVTAGLQLGGQRFRQIIFFEDEQSFNEFTSGNFEFSAQANAVAVKAGAGAGASTAGGTSTSAGTHPSDSHTTGGYHKGMAVFTIARGGLMYEASLGGQKFKYRPHR